MKLKLESFKKKSVWVAIISFAALLGKTYNLFDVPENFNTLVDLGLGILLTLGIIVDA
jgi:uncharacterized membrane protein